MLLLSTRLKVLALCMTIGAGLWVAVLSLRPLLPEPAAKGWEALDDFFYDFLFISTNTQPSSLIIIDSMDLENQRDCADYAVLTQQLYAAGARCVVFDIVFAGDGCAEDMVAFAGGSSQQANTVHAYRFLQYSHVSGSPRCQPIQKFSLRLSALPRFSLATTANAVEAPGDAIVNTARSAGHINIRQQDWRYIPMWIMYEGHLYPALALEAVRRYLGVRDEDFKIEQDLITLKTASETYEIPTDSHGLALINFVPLNEFTRYLRWDAAVSQLHHGGSDFAGALVLIVNSSAPDDPPLSWVPLGETAYPRWAFQASMISQILNRKTIEESLFYNFLITMSLVFVTLVWRLFGEDRVSRQWRRPGWTLLAFNLILLHVAMAALVAGQRMWIVVPAVVFNLTYLCAGHIREQYARTPAYVDFEVLISRTSSGVYPLAVTTGPAGEVESKFRSFLDDPRLDATVGRIKAGTAQKDDLLWLGSKMWEAIFPGNVQLLYESALGRIGPQNCLRFRLRIDAPELRCLPWELLYDQHFRQSYLALSGKASIVRHIPAPSCEAMQKLQRPLKILVVVSSPSDLPPLDVAGEKTAIKRALRGLRFTRSVQLLITTTATLAETERQLQRGVHVLHFIGHSEFDAGRREGRLAFEDEDASAHWLDARAFGAMLAGSSVRLVVLNSCKSAATAACNTFVGLAPKLVRGGIPAVVAMQFNIPDEVALEFGRAFYANLVQSLSIDAAVGAGRQAILTHTRAGSHHWATPVLFMRSNNRLVSG